MQRGAVRIVGGIRIRGEIVGAVGKRGVYDAVEGAAAVRWVGCYEREGGEWLLSDLFRVDAVRGFRISAESDDVVWGAGDACVRLARQGERGAAGCYEDFSAGRKYALSI